MSASRFLAELWQQGVVLRLNVDRSRILVPRRQLTPELQARLADDKPELLQLLGFVEDYRALIRNAFAIMVDRSFARKGLDELASDQARLTDELGAALTTAIRDREARQWRRETGLCPVCGDEGSCDVCQDDDEDLHD
ncbi:MAG TPA: hypothetical protein VF136_11835 [Methylomirabilota bacterium]|jgi:hypothetical protein